MGQRVCPEHTYTITINFTQTDHIRKKVMDPHVSGLPVSSWFLVSKTPSLGWGPNWGVRNKRHWVPVEASHNGLESRYWDMEGNLESYEGQGRTVRKGKTHRYSMRRLIKTMTSMMTPLTWKGYSTSIFVGEEPWGLNEYSRKAGTVRLIWDEW